MYITFRATVFREKIEHLVNEGFAHRKTNTMITEYKDNIESIVNEGKLGRSTHQNMWTFPINKTNDGVASDFSLKGEMGKMVLSEGSRIVDVALKYHPQKYCNEFNAILKFQFFKIGVSFSVRLISLHYKH